MANKKIYYGIRFRCVFLYSFFVRFFIRFDLFHFVGIESDISYDLIALALRRVYAKYALQYRIEHQLKWSLVAIKWARQEQYKHSHAFEGGNDRNNDDSDSRSCEHDIRDRDHRVSLYKFVSYGRKFAIFFEAAKSAINSFNRVPCSCVCQPMCIQLDKTNKTYSFIQYSSLRSVKSIRN